MAVAIVVKTRTKAGSVLVRKMVMRTEPPQIAIMATLAQGYFIVSLCLYYTTRIELSQ